jgi:hypothetical protein
MDATHFVGIRTFPTKLFLVERSRLGQQAQARIPMQKNQPQRTALAATMIRV